MSNQVNWEEVLKKFPRVVARDCAHWIRNDRAFTNEELIQGELASGVQMFDRILEGCAIHKCYDIPDSWYSYLNKLTVSKCLHMKAYYTWEKNGKPIQSDNKIKDDYMMHWNDLWKVEQCDNSMRQDLKKEITGFLEKEMNKKNGDDMCNLKAFYYSLAFPWEGADYHIGKAKSYVADIRAFINPGSTKPNPKQLIQENTAMMSTLEFLFIACNK